MKDWDSLLWIISRIAEYSRENTASDSIRTFDNDSADICFQELFVLKDLIPATLEKLPSAVG